MRFHNCAWVFSANAPGANPGGPVWDRPLRKTKSVPAVHPSRTWAPPRTKARFQPGGETPKGCRKLSGSGHRTETSQLSHPRLCVDQPRRPNWRPRKMGVQGGASISDGAKPHSICGSPLAVLWLLSARAESNPPRRAEPCKTARRVVAQASLSCPLRGNSPSRALRDLQFRPFAEKRGGGKPPPYMMQMPGVTHLSRRGRR